MLHEGSLHPLPGVREFGTSLYNMVNILNLEAAKGAILSLDKTFPCFLEPGFVRLRKAEKILKGVDSLIFDC